MERIKELRNAEYTAKFQQFCGVFYTGEKDPHCCGRGDGASRSEGEIESNITNAKYDGVYDDSIKYLKERIKNRENDVILDQEEDPMELTKTRTTSKKGTPEQDYVIKYRFLLHFFTNASCLGNEAFYLIFYPFCVWNVDALVIRRTAAVWCMCMYVGQAAKDYLRWKRPASPPVVKLETIYLQEYSMPSTHAMSAASIPVMLAYLLTYRYDVSPYLLIGLAIFWCVTVCISRLYLGVHSVLDILVGCLGSFIIIAVSVPYLEDFDLYQQTHVLAPAVTFITGLAMCTVFYPSAKEEATGTISHGDCVQIVSIMAGVSLGTWLNYQCGYTTKIVETLPLAVEIPTLKMIGVSFVRFFIGFATIVMVQQLLKKRCVQFFSYLFGLEKPDTQHQHVMVAYKFVVYYVLGVCIFFFIPLLHYMVGLERPSFYSEV